MQTLVLFASILMGFVNQQQIMNLQEFSNRYKEVKVDQTKLKDISTKDVSVMVVLGTWCGDSVEHVPEFVKINETLRFQSIDWLCVGRKLKDDTGVVKDLKIERVPTFIFFKNGEEIGRIIEHPKKSMVEDIKNILKK